VRSAARHARVPLAHADVGTAAVTRVELGGEHSVAERGRLNESLEALAGQHLIRQRRLGQVAAEGGERRALDVGDDRHDRQSS